MIQNKRAYIDKTVFEDSSTDVSTDKAVADINDERVKILGVGYHLSKICPFLQHPLCSSQSYAPSPINGKDNLHI